MKTASLITAVALTSVCLAEDLTNLPAYKAAPGVIAAEKKAEMLKAVLELPQPEEGPVAKLDVQEFQLKQGDYVGQVVQLTFDQVLTLKQEGSAGYIAQVAYKREERADTDRSFVEIAVSSEGLETFQEIYELRGSTRQTRVMVQVLVGSKTRALGTRYRKDAPEGEKYRW